MTDVAVTITHLLENSLVTTYDAEKILWALLGNVYLYEVEEGKRSKYEIVDMIEAQRELLLKDPVHVITPVHKIQIKLLG